MQRIINFWRDLRSSLWFVPILMLLGAIALALGLIEVDSRVDGDWSDDFPRLFGLGADGSRGMLTAIAGSMLTVAALTFALTLNAMTQASGQFTPRIFRNFMRDRANQFVLGYFVGVFAYCLLVLRTIRGGDEFVFVPSLAVLFGLALAIGGIIALIFFIHHISDSLQITTIIDNIVDETINAMKRMFPAGMGTAAEAGERKNARDTAEQHEWKKIPALECGYVQNADTDRLLGFAEENNLILRMERGIGQFVGRGAAVVSLVHLSEGNTGDDAPDDETVRKINGMFDIDRHRTIEQDVGFGIRQIVDIALKALSPGVNDTTTAVTCVDYLGEIVGELARREFPATVRMGKDGACVIASAPDFESYVVTAFEQVRISADANLAILLRLIDSFAFIVGCTDDKSRHLVLQEHITLTAESAERTLETDYEKIKFRKRLEKVNSSVGRA